VVWAIAPSKSRLQKALAPRLVLPSCPAPSQNLGAVLLRVKDQAGKPIPQKQFAPISFGFGQQRQESVSHFRRNLFSSQNFECLREVENL
jgi:hypothetical protein